MTLKINWQYILGFLSLNMVLGELHEQAHIQTGYAICGCYGERNMSVWTTCVSCLHPSYAIWATVAGPLFSYFLYWAAAYWIIRHRKDKSRFYAMAILFASLPFARIFTAVMGGGDEKIVILHLLENPSSQLPAKILAVLVTLVFCLPPLMVAIRQLPEKNKAVYVAGFVIGPLLFGMIWQRFFLNSLLSKGLGTTQFLAGTPILVMIHFFAMLLLFFIFGRYLSPPGKNN
ncbi:MAG: hypothetical protein KGO92_12045 [Bacteroidota bacterium]|nr:hypothetical protein [Bacteroidota bacterium]